jgi:hypothetical protein
VVLKKIKLQEAVGSKLAHDITEIRPGEFKGPAFREGHTDLGEDEIHENEAATIMAEALAGEGIVWKDEPREGKISLLAGTDGLLTVNTATLAAFNMVDEVMCATLHNHTLVKEGELVAGTRAIPLVMKRAPIERAASIARQNGGAVLSVRPLRTGRVGLVITGNEVYHGLISDRFAPILTEKVEALGSEVVGLEFAPDDPEAISQVILPRMIQKPSPK